MLTAEVPRARDLHTASDTVAVTDRAQRRGSGRVETRAKLRDKRNGSFWTRDPSRVALAWYRLRSRSRKAPTVRAEFTSLGGEPDSGEFYLRFTFNPLFTRFWG